MNKAVTLLFLFAFPLHLLAQENNTLKDYNLKGNVIKISEKGYRYDGEAGKYVNISTTESEFINGLLQYNSLEYDDFLAEWTETFYRYNEDNTLKEVVYYSVYDSTTTATVTFQYSNKKPVERKEVADVTIIRNYEYDANGNLIQEIKRSADGRILEKVVYSDYTTADSYQKEITIFENDKVLNTTKETYSGGLRKQKTFVSEFSNETTVYEYDNNRLPIAEKSGDGEPSVYNYVTDEAGNAVKTRMFVNGGGILPDMNIFLFSEITYADGKITGSKNFDAEFIRQYEPESESYEIGEAIDWSAADQEEMQRLSLALQKDASPIVGKSNLWVVKNADETFIVQNAAGERIYGTAGLTSTNELDLLIYNPADNTSSIIQNFYDSSVVTGQMYNADLLSSATGIFWILTDEPNFYLIEKGAVLDMTRYDLVKVPGSEVDFYVTEDGVEKYILRSINLKEFDTIYALELKP